ncbi:nucleotidyltransferase domain-containing protein [Desulfofarcimen acetoxidans]|nr:nucleotidyltransferase family protein [Desulfofarcimen acetoxidans]
MLDNPFKKIPHELSLMLASISSDTTKTEMLLNKPTDWQFFAHLAVHHRVYPIVYKTLSQLNNPVVPGNVLCLLRQKCRENTIKALSMTGETVRIVKCLENHGIPCLVLKGVPLALRLYGDIYLRPSKDIDILVHPDLLEKAQAILENEGYYRIDTKNLTTRQLEIYSKASPNSFHFSYWHSSKEINLELHIKPIDRGYVLSLPIEGNVNRIGIAGNPLPVLLDEEWLLYLILHGAKHAWFRLRWLNDIVKFLQQEKIDWNNIMDLVRKTNMQTTFHQSLIMANLLMDLPVPPILLTTVAKDRYAWKMACNAMNLCLIAVDNEISKTNSYTNRQLLYDFQIHNSWKSRYKFLMRLIGPNIRDIKLIALPDKLYVLYYIIRPFTFLSRRLQKLRTRN